MSNSEVIKLPFCDLAIEPNTVIVVNFKKGHYVEPHDVLAFVDYIYQLSQGKPFGTIALLKGVNNDFSNEALKMLSNPPLIAKTWLAEALVLDSLAHRILYKLYSVFNKKDQLARSVKMFSNEKDAQDWVEKILDKQ